MPKITKNVIQLSQLLNEISKAKHATIIFGAGISVALAGAKATWTDFLNRLVNSITTKHLAKHKKGGTSHWLGAEALEHRLHTIRSLTHGDSDAAVAATYLIDRVHAVLDGRAGTRGRNEELNTASYELEDEWLARSSQPEVQHWNRLLRILGDHARAGKAFLITTNFDHCIARATGLPIFLGGWTSPFSVNAPHMFQARQDGVVIQGHRTAERVAWTDAQISASNNEGIAPYIHNQAWSKPGTIPRNWWPGLASIFHVHGSRLVPPSIVFDAASYSLLDSATQILKSSEILRNLLSKPKDRGPVIFLGCKGTLLDPHFIEYWNKNYNGGSYTGTSGQTITVLQKKDDIDPLAREMYGHCLLSPPAFCSYGSKHGDLLGTLEQIVAAL